MRQVLDRLVLCTAEATLRESLSGLAHIETAALLSGWDEMEHTCLLLLPANFVRDFGRGLVGVRDDMDTA